MFHLADLITASQFAHFRLAGYSSIQVLMNTDPVISVRALEKSYADVHAVKGITFEVGPGEVFGLLGPNGAGKTSTVEILEGLRPPSSGDAKALGFVPEPQTHPPNHPIGPFLPPTYLP